MSITTYAELQTAVSSWLGRTDLNSNIPDFITLFEAHAVRELQVRDIETTATINTTSGNTSLPSDFLAALNLTWNGTTKKDIPFVSPSQLTLLYPTDPTADPEKYTIQAGSLIIRPIDDTTSLQLWYRSRTSSVASTLNWLFTNHPDAYMAGTLVEANLFVEDIETAAIWEARRDKILGSIKMLDFSYRQAPRIMIDGPTP